METLSKVFEDKYNKNVKDCTNEEIYHGLLSWTKEQLKGRGYQDGKKKIYYISAEFLIGKLLSNNRSIWAFMMKLQNILKRTVKSFP